MINSLFKWPRGHLCLLPSPLCASFHSLLIPYSSLSASLLHLSTSQFSAELLPNCPLPPFQSVSCLHSFTCSSPGVYIVDQVQNIIWFLYFCHWDFLQMVKKWPFFSLAISSGVIIYTQALESRMEPMNYEVSLPLLGVKHRSRNTATLIQINFPLSRRVPHICHRASLRVSFC